MATPLAAAPLAGVPLDTDQQKAANHRKGTACVAASAGSGKTTLLVGRAMALVDDGAAPSSVLTLVFNKNAQLTLAERLEANPSTKGYSQAMAATFHSFAYQCCRLVMPGLQVLGTSAEDGARQEQRGGGADAPRMTARDLGKRVWDRMGGSIYGAMRPEIVKGTDLDEVMRIESGARERLFAAGWPNAFMKPDATTTPAHRTLLRDALRALQLRDMTPDVLTALVEFMPGFRKERMAAQAVDFTDMMVGLGNFIRKGDEKVMTRLRQIQHLQVDEAQDGNELRWYVAQTVAGFGGERSVMAVGDLRQSIAGFAGATPAMFHAWWDKADKQFSLPRNYRSSSAIVAAGNAVAKGEAWNIGGDAVAARADLGIGSVRVEPVGTLGIAVEISAAVAAGLDHKEVTVLARTRAALETVAFGLRTKGLKVFVRGGGFVWKGMDGRMVRAYLDFAAGIMRDQKALGMALNKPKRFVSPNLLSNSANGRGPWFTGSGQISQQLFQDSRSYPPARAVKEAYETLSNLIWEDQVQQVEEWLLEGLNADSKENAQAPDAKSDKADLIRNLCEIAKVCGSVQNLDIAIEAETKLDPKDPDVIELSTIHQAKGDQWSVVYVTGVKEGIFPHIKATQDEEFAEEVRLLYVAVTRPVHTLVVDVTDANRFGPKLVALAAVAATTTPPPPASPPQPHKRTTEPSSEPLVTFPVEEASGVVTQVSAAELVEAVNADEARAFTLTRAGVQPQDGERFVPVRWDELTELLQPHGFDESRALAARMNQRVLSATLKDGAQVVVYTSVPPGAAEARGLGEDSIKVVLLNPKGYPYGKKQPYAARTRNWRVTLLTRIVEALQVHPSLKESAA